MTQTVPDISPLMPMHQDPLLGCHLGWHHFSDKQSRHACMTPHICSKHKGLRNSWTFRPLCQQTPAVRSYKGDLPQRISDSEAFVCWHKGLLWQLTVDTKAFVFREGSRAGVWGHAWAFGSRNEMIRRGFEWRDFCQTLGGCLDPDGDWGLTGCHLGFPVTSLPVM